MALAVWHDFSPLLDIFGAQSVEVRIPPQWEIDPTTNEERLVGTETTLSISAVVVPAVALAASSLGTTGVEFLPQGVVEQADYILFLKLDSPDSAMLTVAEDLKNPTVVIIDNERYGVIKDQRWHLGNIRILAVRKMLPGPP